MEPFMKPPYMSDTSAQYSMDKQNVQWIFSCPLDQLHTGISEGVHWVFWIHWIQWSTAMSNGHLNVKWPCWPRYPGH